MEGITLKSSDVERMGNFGQKSKLKLLNMQSCINMGLD